MYSRPSQQNLRWLIMLEESDYYASKVYWKNVITKIDADTIATNFS